jgi:peptidoglycan/LPS O-acetylase OafA/YrhL
MGTYRLSLSLIVVLFHFGGYPPLAGRVAVFAFFVLSGYLMALVIERAYGYSPAGAARFLLNRALRLVPLFLACVALTIVILEARDGRSFFVDPLEPLFLNVQKGGDLLATGFVTREQWSPLPILTGTNSLLPQSWSLVIEGFFYLTAPLLAFLHSRVRPLFFALFAGSLGLNVYILAGGYEFDSWIYQNFYAALWVFLLGMLLYYERGRIARLPGKKIISVVLFVAFVDLVVRQPDMDVETGFYAGIVLAAGLTVVLAQVTWPGWFRRIDKVAGDIAYGVFLNHFVAGLIVLTANEYILRERGTFNFFGRLNQIQFGFWTAIVSLVIAAAMFVIFERPLHVYRDRVRGIPISPQPAPPPAAAPAPAPAVATTATSA